MRKVYPEMTMIAKRIYIFESSKRSRVDIDVCSALRIGMKRDEIVLLGIKGQPADGSDGAILLISLIQQRREGEF